MREFFFFFRSIVLKIALFYNPGLTFSYAGRFFMNPIVSFPHSYSPASSPKEQAEARLLAGTIELEKNNFPAALQHIRKALASTPEDRKMHIEAGAILLKFGSKESHKEALLSSAKIFKTGKSLDPANFEFSAYRGTALSFLGSMTGEFHYFIEAKKAFEEAVSLCKETEGPIFGNLYSSYALVLAAAALRSQEAYDWHLCITTFEKAAPYVTVEETDFWNSFGRACMEYFPLLRDLKLIVRAAQCFKKALTKSPRHKESWSNLADAMSLLYTQTRDEEHFLGADQCFAVALRSDPSDLALHTKRAAFFLYAAKQTQDPVKLASALEKCKNTPLIDTQMPPLLAATWGEALCLTGEHFENVHLIYEGQNLLIEALEARSDLPFLWGAFGESFLSLGRYFDEIDYLYQAAERFQTGLSSDRTRHELWSAMGNAYLLIGKASEDLSALKKSLYFQEKAIALEPSIPAYHFLKAEALLQVGEIRREESISESAIRAFETGFSLQKNGDSPRPDHLFGYGKALDLHADFFDDESLYHKAIEVFLHVLMIDASFPKIRYHLGLAYSHLAELSSDLRNFQRALYLFKLASKQDDDDDRIAVDWAVTLINIASLSPEEEAGAYYREAEAKLIRAIQNGNLAAYYQLGCLFSLLENEEKALFFLEKAEAFRALPPPEDILVDEWLDPVRSKPAFQEFFLRQEKRTEYREE